MARYTIEWLEMKETSTGKRKADATIKGEDGHNQDVTIWADFPGFAELNPGATVEGEIKPASDPKYKPSLSPARSPYKAQGGGYKAKVMEDAMVRKETSISKFQDNKEQSIKLISAQRDAVLMVTTFYKDQNLDSTELKEKVVSWRDWFLSEKFNETLPF